jgi:predicted RecA/RadA family phage recombinase
MQNYIQEGESLKITNATGEAIASGSPVFKGAIVGVAQVDISNNKTGVILTEGVFNFTKVAPLVIAEGDRVYWGTTNKRITKTTTDKFIGIAVNGGALSAATTVDVKLDMDYSNIAVNVAQIATANGSDAATTQALANQLKTTVNALLTALKNAGIVVAD